MTKAVSLSLRAITAAYAACSLMILAVVGTINSSAPVVHWAPFSTGVVAPVGDLPNVSIETSAGARITLAATNGYVRIATMFYAHCPGVCPMTLETLRKIDAGLSERQRSQLNFVLLSLDPARDSRLAWFSWPPPWRRSSGRSIRASTMTLKRPVVRCWSRMSRDRVPVEGFLNRR